MMQNPAAEALLHRLEALAVKRGVLVSSLADIDLGLVMQCAVEGLPPAQDLSEAAINQALIGWLETAGSMLHTDHVELRRTLIDLQFLERDGFGRAYQRPLRVPDRFRDVVGVLSDENLAHVVEHARTAHQVSRELRRAEHGARPSGAS